MQFTQFVVVVIIVVGGEELKGEIGKGKVNHEAFVLGEIPQQLWLFSFCILI